MTLKDAEKWLNDQQLCFVSLDDTVLDKPCFKEIDFIVLARDGQKYLVTVDELPVGDFRMAECLRLFGETYRHATMAELIATTTEKPDGHS